MDRITGALQVIGQIEGALAAPVDLSGNITVPEVIRPDSYPGPYDVTPTEEQQTLTTEGLVTEEDIVIDPIPSEYHDTSGATLSSGDQLLKGVKGYGQDALYTGTVEERTSSDVTVSGPDITIPAGAYAAEVHKSVAAVTQATPTISVGSDGLITAAATQAAGYVNAGTKTATEQLSTQAGKTVSPTESEQTAVAGGKYTTGAVKVGAVSKTYVGSEIARRDETDLSVSGPVVTVPAGYYEDTETATIGSGTEGTPTASKSAVSNHGVSVTPSVTNAAGYIAGGTKTGSAVTVTASELVSGKKSITANGNDIDVTEYAKVDVAVPIPSPNLQTKSATYTPSTSQQTDTVSADDGYDGLEEVNVTVEAMQNATWKAGSILQPTITMEVDQNGLVSASDYGSHNIQPLNASGYVQSNKWYNVITNGSGSKQLSTQAGTTITPSESQQTAVAAGKFTTGAVVVDPIPSEYIVPSGKLNITQNGTGIDVSEYAEVDVAVSGGSPNLQTKSESYTPTESAQTDTIEADQGYDGLDQVNITVNAISSSYVGSAIDRRDGTDLSASGPTVTVPAGYYEDTETKTIASGTEGTPTATKGTVSSHAITVTPSVTNAAGYISGGTHNGTGVSVSASELVSGTYSVTGSGTKDVTNYASISVPAGSEGTPTATKGAVNNHSISVTPSVTNTGGYISGSTKTGTAATVSASELVSGNKEITANGTNIDVTGYATVSVAVPGGGGSGGLTLISTTSIGSLSTSSTSTADTGKSISLASSTGWKDYDLLIVDVSVDSETNGRHTSTVSFVLITHQSSYGTPSNYAVSGNKWNSKKSSSGTATTRQSTTAYGIYANSASVSNNTMTIPLYYRYNSNNTGTINGTYTARVYGVKLYDLIGG